jgi:hypothetical protein
MKRIAQTLFASVASLFIMTQSASAGIPIAKWATPYLIVVSLVMFAIMGVTALLKPSDVIFKDISPDNSSTAAVIGLYLSYAAGAAVMCVFGVGVVGALFA